MYPQIVPPELYAKVRTKVNKNKYGKRSIRQVYFLRGLLKCGYCGMPITADSGKARNGNYLYYYKCSGRKKKLTTCTKCGIQKDILEKFILNKVINELKNPQTMDVIVKGLLDIQKNLAIKSNELSILQKQKIGLQNSLNNIMAAIEQGIITKTTSIRIKEIENQLDELEKNILIEKNKTSIIIPENVIRTYYNNLLELEPITLISTLIKEIKLYDDKAEVTFNSPIKTSPTESEGFLFCTKLERLKISTLNQKENNTIDFLVNLYV